MIDRIANWLHWLRDSIIGEWRVTIRDQLTHEQMMELALKRSIPSLSYYFLLSLSALIATSGLIANSAATIIGAMIISPLKTPIDTLSYGLVQSDARLIRRSLWTLSTGIVLIVLVSYFLSIAIGSRFAGPEILSRGNPTLLDLVVALAAGAAGAFSLTRPNLADAPAGVAIAVALVPPLCVVGIGLGMGERLSAAHIASVGHYSLAVGAGLLFFTNLVAIAFSAATVFLIGSLSTAKQAAVGMSITLVFVLAIALPLNTSLQKLVQENYAKSEIRQTAFESFPQWKGQIENIFINSDLSNNTLSVEANIIAPENLVQIEDVQTLQQALSSKMNLPVELNIRVVPYQLFEVRPEASIASDLKRR